MKIGTGIPGGPESDTQAAALVTVAVQLAQISVVLSHNDGNLSMVVLAEALGRIAAEMEISDDHMKALLELTLGTRSNLLEEEATERAEALESSEKSEKKPKVN